jgi:hypothetical protein
MPTGEVGLNAISTQLDVNGGLDLSHCKVGTF